MTFKELLATGRIEGPGSSSQAYRPRIIMEKILLEKALTMPKIVVKSDNETKNKQF